MKKLTLSLALVLSLLVLLCMAAACADSPAAAPAKAAETEDPLVGAWKMPPSPFGEDYRCHLVLNADGSFLYTTTVPGSAGKADSQTVSTNETFTWKRVGKADIELHYDYHDDNGEFVTTLTYRPKEGKLYLWDSVYAERDDSFVLLVPAEKAK